MSFIFEECLFSGCDVIVAVLLQYFNFNLKILSLNEIAKELREKNDDILSQHSRHDIHKYSQANEWIPVFYRL